MTEKRTVNYQGKDTTGTSIDFEIDREDWNVYKLKDGTVLKFKTIVSDIVRLDGLYNEENDPIYVVRSGNIINANVAADLKKSQNSGEVN